MFITYWILCGFPSDRYTKVVHRRSGKRARHPRLQKRGSRYFLRVKVPTDLRSAVGKREVRKALGTSEPREALKRVRQASAETDAMFEALRGKVAANEAALVPASAVDLERIIRQEFHEMEIRTPKAYFRGR